MLIELSLRWWSCSIIRMQSLRRVSPVHACDMLQHTYPSLAVFFSSACGLLSMVDRCSRLKLVWQESECGDGLFKVGRAVA